MVYEQQLSFLQQLLKNMNISSCILSEPGQRIPPEIDLYLRADLFGLENYADFLQNSPNMTEEIRKPYLFESPLQFICFVL